MSTPSASRGVLHYHPESDSYFVMDEFHPGDGLVHDVTGLPEHEAEAAERGVVLPPKQSSTPTVHAAMGASVLERRIECQGSMQAEEGLPDNAGEAARQGTAAHWVLNEVLSHHEDPFYTGEARDWLNCQIDGGEVLNADSVAKVDAAVEAFNHYLALLKAMNAGPVRVLLEQRLVLDHISPDLFGTGDIILYNDIAIASIDYKNGAGVVVDIVKNGKPNWQVVFYSLGTVRLLGKLGHVFKHDPEVYMVISQPARGGTKELILRGSDLFDAGTEIMVAYDKARAPNPPRKAGPWCKFCKAAAAQRCKEYDAVAYDNAVLTFLPRRQDGTLQIVASTPEHLDDDELEEKMAVAVIAKQWANGVFAYAEQRARMGAKVRGWKLVAKEGHRYWHDPRAAYTVLAARVGIDQHDFFELEPRTPAQVEKVLVRKKIKPADRAAVMKALIGRDVTGSSFVPDTDARPALQTAQLFQPQPADGEPLQVTQSYDFD